MYYYLPETNSPKSQQASQRTHDQRVQHRPLAKHRVPRRQTQKPVRASQAGDLGAALPARAGRVDESVGPGREDDAVVLRAFGIARDVLVQDGFDPRQAVGCVGFPAREAERGQEEEVGRDERGGGVAGEAEDGFGGGVAGGGFEGDGGEGGGFAGLHGDAAEVDGAAEGAFDGRLEEVELAHGDAARGHDDVDGAEGAS